jgi:hypothetical protein
MHTNLCIIARIHDKEEEETPPIFNFQTMLVEQGFPYQVGLHPPVTNVTDNPLQIWTYSIANSTSSDAMYIDTNMADVSIVLRLNVNVMQSVDQQIHDANKEALVNFARANSVFQQLQAPRLSLDNSYFFVQPLQMSGSMLFEVIGEYFMLVRNKSRKISFTARPKGGLSISRLQVDTTHKTLPWIDLQVVGQKRKMDTPSVTTEVRRSPRQNKYDGFKVHQTTDAKINKSKVKPRKCPLIKPDVTDQQSKSNSTSEVLPPTPMPVLQQIGINLCGIHPSALSPQQLLADLPDDDVEVSL